ncbi:MAG: phospholipid carrier-dependent glycosyltransferase [Chloroflexi bacterium]|nr:phospholipid carrier-dependent glycosyltransferase [Chloroflexota bacterium]
MTSSRARWPVILLLALILLIAFALRTYNVDWADGQLPHPDERSTIAFYAPTIKWPTEPGTLLDPRRSTLNPLWDVNAQHRRSYTYGHFPLYLLVIGGNLTVKLAPLAETLGAPEKYVSMMRIANGSPGFAWVGRVLMAIADTITVLYVFLLARRLYGQWAGLLAAALSAFTVLQIQLAHFFAVDPISTTFTVAAIYHATRMVDKRSWGQTILTGVMAALAIASKFSAAPILAAPVVAGLIIMWRQAHEEEKGAGPPGLLLAATALVVAAFAFAVTSPFVILDFENFYEAVIKEQGAMVRGIADFPFTRQYRGTTPYLYFIDQQIRWGMGWALGIVGWLAFGWVMVKALMRRAQPGELITLSWLIPYFLITGSFLAKFMRYMVPVVPLLTMLAAGMLWTLAIWIARRAETRDQRSEAGGQEAEEETIVPSSHRPIVESETSAQYPIPHTQYPISNTQYPTPNTQPLKLWSDSPPIPPQGEAGKRARRWFAIFGAIVLVPTILWALAFVNGVYRTEHPFITASRWMYENIPNGSVWITEHWEEGMPLILPIPGGNPGAHGWRNVVMPMYEEDTEGKFEIIKQNMREGDYYVLATKRLYGALPRLPERYPMSIKFYELLFEGKLGYELAAEFTTYPQLFGVEIPDQSADESFWVYDHPRVLIYKKVRDLSDEEWNALLDRLWEQAIPGYTGQRPQDRGAQPVATEKESGPDLLLDQPVNQLPDVGRVAWNPLRNSSFASLLFWWLALLGVHLLTWPISFAVFANLRDRGYGFNRALGLILLAWFSWILPSLRIVINSWIPILFALAVVGGLSYAVWRRKRDEMRVFWNAYRPFIYFSEALFTLAFLFFVFIRLLNPDLWQPWQGGEKFMEFAFFNAVLRTPYFPPYDPYFAGGTMNYYYYGYQVLGTLVKLTGIRPSIAFNLAIPTLFALTVSGVFSLVYSLMPLERFKRRIGSHARVHRGVPANWWQWGIGAGLAGAFFVALMGNLDGGLIVLRQIAERSGSAFTSNIPLVQSAVRTAAGFGKIMAGEMDLPSYNFWDPSRVIPFTINEFPFWSFLFADLHPHMMGIPFTVLFLALAFNLVAGYGQRWDAEGRLSGALFGLSLPLTLGAIGAINTWDLPTYLGVGVLAWGLREWKGYGKLRIVPSALFVVGLAALSYLLYRPFYANYTTVFNTGVGLTYIKTDLGVWLRIWGFFMFMALSYVIMELRYAPGDVAALRWVSGLMNHFDRPARYLDHMRALARPDWRLSFGQAVMGLALLAGLLAAWLGYPVIGLLFPLVVFTALFLFRRTTTAESQFRALLFFTGLLVLLGVEIFYLKDFLCGCGEGLFTREHGDYYRMNTLFKFYIQAWVLLGVASASALPALFDRIRHWTRGWRWTWHAIFAFLIILGLVFPFFGTASRVNDRFPGERPPRNTLDGMAYMTVGKYFWPDGSNAIELKYDYEAIRWLQENVTGTPVLAEAPASWYPVNGQNVGYDYYRAGGLRVSSMTGLPTFLGQHQGEQRFGYQTGPREQAGREFWETTDINRLRQLIHELNVDYIYVGQLERTLFSPQQLAKFDQLVQSGEATIVFQNPGVTIYKIER